MTVDSNSILKGLKTELDNNKYVIIAIPIWTLVTAIDYTQDGLFTQQCIDRASLVWCVFALGLFLFCAAAAADVVAESRLVNQRWQRNRKLWVVPVSCWGRFVDQAGLIPKHVIQIGLVMKFFSDLSLSYIFVMLTTWNWFSVSDISTELCSFDDSGKSWFIAAAVTLGVLFSIFRVVFPFKVETAEVNIVRFNKEDIPHTKGSVVLKTETASQHYIQPGGAVGTKIYVWNGDEDHPKTIQFHDPERPGEFALIAPKSHIVLYKLDDDDWTKLMDYSERSQACCCCTGR